MTRSKNTVDSQKIQCRSRSAGFFRISRSGSTLPSHTLCVQSIDRNYSVDLDRMTSSEVADQDLYCLHTHYYVAVDCQKLSCRARSAGFFRGSRPGSIPGDLYYFRRHNMYSQ